MRELEKKLKELQRHGYENVSIVQVLNWLYEIKMRTNVKRIERKGRVKI